MFAWQDEYSPAELRKNQTSKGFVMFLPLVGRLRLHRPLVGLLLDDHYRARGPNARRRFELWHLRWGAAHDPSDGAVAAKPFGAHAANFGQRIARSQRESSIEVGVVTSQVDGQNIGETGIGMTTCRGHCHGVNV